MNVEPNPDHRATLQKSRPEDENMEPGISDGRATPTFYRFDPPTSRSQRMAKVHPAFTRASGSRALGYHLALTVALTLAPLAVVPAEEHGFVTRSLAEWGHVETAVRKQQKGRRRT